MWTPITHISTSAPALITAPAHGLVDELDVTLQSVRGMSSINGLQTQIRIIDADTLALDCINSIDYTPYAGGGVLKSLRPVDLTGATARQHIRATPGGPLLLELSSTAPAGEPRLIIDLADCTIAREIPAAITQTLAWAAAVYDLEITQGGHVTTIARGPVTVQDEITA